MEKTDFYYYLHKTKITDSNMIESIFSNGLTSWYGTNIHSTIYPIDEKQIEENGLDSVMQNYLGDGDEYNSVFLFKIPKKYMTDRIHRDGKIDPPVPFLKQNEDETLSIISPLIQGVYCRDINKSFTNPNFSPVFDPTGLKYSDEQIQNLWGLNLSSWINFAKGRANSSFDELSTIDKNAHNWDRVVQFYSAIYGETIKPQQEYIMPDTDKSLFGGRTL
jgi:hypothetical protein